MSDMAMYYHYVNVIAYIVALTIDTFVKYRCRCVNVIAYLVALTIDIFVNFRCCCMNMIARRTL